METPKEAPTGAKKDSTNAVPMFDLQEIINFVASIHDKGLEAVSMPEVAKGIGYSNPTSTPFYRRLTAARLFGMLSNSKAELTLRAKEYLKPTTEGAKAQSLTDAIMGVPLYASEVQKLFDKKLNIQFVANSFSKALNLTDGGAMICARAFESSLKLAGFLTPDGLVIHPLIGAPAKAKPSEAPAADAGRDEEEDALPIETKGKTKTHSLPLNKEGTRVITVNAPLDITEKEIKRIQKWMEVTLLIEWDMEEEITPP